MLPAIGAWAASAAPEMIAALTGAVGAAGPEAAAGGTSALIGYLLKALGFAAKFPIKHPWYSLGGGLALGAMGGSGAKEKPPTIPESDPGMMAGSGNNTQADMQKAYMLMQLAQMQEKASKNESAYMPSGAVPADHVAFLP